MLCCVEMYSANFFDVQIYKLCKYFLFLAPDTHWSRWLVVWKHFVVQIYLFCKYICCAYIVVVQIFAFTGARYPLKQMLCCVRRETFLCKPHSLGTATHLFTSANLFKTYNMPLREVFCSRFLLDKSPIVVCLVTHYSLLSQCWLTTWCWRWYCGKS